MAELREYEDGVTENIGSQLFQAGRGGRQGSLQVITPENGRFEYTCGWGWNVDDQMWEGDGVAWGEDGYNNPEHLLNTWEHYAFVKDATE